MIIVCSSDPPRAYSRRIVRSIVLPGAVSRDLDPPGPLDRRQGARRKITAQGVARSDIGDAPQARPLTVILAR